MAAPVVYRVPRRFITFPEDPPPYGFLAVSFLRAHGVLRRRPGALRVPGLADRPVEGLHRQPRAGHAVAREPGARSARAGRAGASAGVTAPAPRPRPRRRRPRRPRPSRPAGAGRGARRPPPRAPEVAAAAAEDARALGAGPAQARGEGEPDAAPAARGEGRRADAPAAAARDAADGAHHARRADAPAGAPADRGPARGAGDARPRRRRRRSRPARSGVEPIRLGRPNATTTSTGSIAVDASDFPFTYYLRLIQSKIGERWSPPRAAAAGGRTSDRALRDPAGWPGPGAHGGAELG